MKTSQWHVRWLDRQTLWEMEYRGGKVLQRWCGSGGDVRLSHLLISFLFQLLVQLIP